MLKYYQYIIKTKRKQTTMETTESEDVIESVTMSDILNLSSWDRPRSPAELHGFMARHEAVLLADEPETDD